MVVWLDVDILFGRHQQLNLSPLEPLDHVLFSGGPRLPQLHALEFFGPIDPPEGLIEDAAERDPSKRGRQLEVPDGVVEVVPQHQTKKKGEWTRVHGENRGRSGLRES